MSSSDMESIPNLSASMLKERSSASQPEFASMARWPVCPVCGGGAEDAATALNAARARVRNQDQRARAAAAEDVCPRPPTVFGARSRRYDVGPYVVSPASSSPPTTELAAAQPEISTSRPQGPFLEIRQSLCIPRLPAAIDGGGDLSGSGDRRWRDCAHRQRQ